MVKTRFTSLTTTAPNSGNVPIAGKKVGHQISVSFEKFDVVQALLSFFYTILADSL
jgi:hypothetical protein